MADDAASVDILLWPGRIVSEDTRGAPVLVGHPEGEGSGCCDPFRDLFAFVRVPRVFAPLDPEAIRFEASGFSYPRAIRIRHQGLGIKLLITFSVCQGGNRKGHVPGDAAFG